MARVRNDGRADQRYRSTRFIGEPGNGRYGEHAIYRCPKCGNKEVAHNHSECADAITRAAQHHETHDTQ